MQYFCSFDSYSLFLLQSENIRYTKCPISTQPAKKNKLLHHLCDFCVNLCLVFLSLKISYFNGPLSLEHFSGKGNL